MGDLAWCLSVGVKAARSLLEFSDDFRSIGEEIHAAYFFFRDVEQMRAISTEFIDTVCNLPPEIKEKCSSIGSTIDMFQYVRKKLKFALKSIGGRPEGELSRPRQMKLHFKWTFRQKKMDRIQAEMQATRVAATCHILILNTRELGLAIRRLQARGEPIPMETRNKYKKSCQKALDYSHEAEELFDNLPPGQASTFEGVSTRAIERFIAAFKVTQIEAEAVLKDFDQVQQQMNQQDSDLLATPTTKQQFKMRPPRYPRPEPPQMAASGQPSTQARHTVPASSPHHACPPPPQNKEHEEGNIGFFGARVRDNGRTVTTEEGMWPRSLFEQLETGQHSTTSSSNVMEFASGISFTTQSGGSSDRDSINKAGSSSSISRESSSRRKKRFGHPVAPFDEGDR